jgi:hypothetical protein
LWRSARIDRSLRIGANTALFSIFNSLILRPLPVRDPGTLALLTDGSWSYPIWTEIMTRETELFDGAFAWSGQRFDLSAGGQAEPVDERRRGRWCYFYNTSRKAPKPSEPDEKLWLSSRRCA